jgi:hypothetical protein
MPSKAERDRINRSRFWIFLVLASSFAFQYVYESLKHGWVSGFFTALADTVPNIIAGALVALVVGWWITDVPRERYLGSIRSVRKVLGQARERKEIAEAPTRRIIASVVREMSNLYFDSDRPPLEPEDKRDLEPARCGTCKGKSRMRGGLCNDCFDISDAWLEEAPAESQGIAQNGGN